MGLLFDAGTCNQRSAVYGCAPKRESWIDKQRKRAERLGYLCFYWAGPETHNLVASLLWVATRSVMADRYKVFSSRQQRSLRLDIVTRSSHK
jgi:hypothetical protein